MCFNLIIINNFLKKDTNYFYVKTISPFAWVCLRMILEVLICSFFFYSLCKGILNRGKCYYFSRYFGYFKHWFASFQFFVLYSLFKNTVLILSSKLFFFGFCFCFVYCESIFNCKKKKLVKFKIMSIFWLTF